LVIDNEEVYLTESVPFVGSGSPQGSVKRFPLPDGPIQSLVTGLSGPNEVATDKLDVYWTQFDPYPSGPLKTIPKSGGSIATVVSFPFGLEDLTVGDEAVYFLGGSVLKVIKPNPVSGGGGWSEEPPE
jgi:hypothetical protein